MITPDIRDHAYQFFIEEAPELLQTIEDGLLTLRSERTQGKVHEMMRAAHSLKGGAASVELPVIKEISHRLEDIFKAFYNESVVIDEDMESLLLQAYDCLKDPLLTQIRDGSFDEATALNQANPVFEAIEFLLGDNLAAGDQFIPSSADLGVDIVSSLFEVDIVQGLEQIKMALESQQAELVQETLTAQTEVFAGLAEILNLSGFKAITEAVQTALQLHPDQIIKLAEVAVQDWQGSCDQVLQKGDRQQGGTPSAALLSLSGWSEESSPQENGHSHGLMTGEMLPDPGNLFGEMPVIEEGDLFALNDIPAPLEGDIFALNETPAPLENDVFNLGEIPAPLTTDAFNLGEIPAPLTGEVFGLGEIPAPPISPTPASLIAAQPETVDIHEPSYQFFIEEAPELLHMIEQGLLTLRTERTQGKVHEIMRAAHSLKGGAASVGLLAIKEISHRLEDIFKAFYNESLVLDENLETLLLEAYDCLKNPLEEQINTGYYDPQVALNNAMPLLDAIAFNLGDYLSEGEQYLPSSADLGVDIVASLFEVDITQGLTQLQTALATQEPTLIQETLTAQTEVFLGLAEILNLSGFKAIGEAVQQALQNQPDQVLVIAQQALTDWQNSCDQVLNQGDRREGGRPSSALLALTQKATSEKVPLQADTTPRISLSNLFGEEEEEEIPIVPEPVTEEIVAPEIVAEPAVLPEDVFASFALEMEAENAVTPATTETEEVTPELPPAPDLEVVFGGLIPDALAWEESPIAETEAPPALDTEQLVSLVQSVEQVFEQLPIAEVSPPPVAAAPEAMLPTPTVQTTSTQAQSPEKPAQPATPASLSIRVDFQRLERMNNWVGELAINRNSLSLQNDQLQTSVRALLRRFSNFQNMTNKLRLLADQLVIMPDADGRFRMRSERQDWMSNAFDSLEMDSYGALSGQLQDILEEMMQLEEAVDDIVLFARATNQSLEEQRQMLFSLRDELMWARMLPLGEVLNRFPRVLRDLSTKYHKPVQLKLYGTAVLVDRLALEKLYDPLMHLLRNAFDHGIEPPDVRRSQGKSEQGTIEIHAYHQGNQTIIELRDDGGGLKTERIAKQGIEKGLITEDQAQRMTPEQIHNLVFEPNFSTASQVSELSGRGVGLDVVRQQLQSLKGTVTVSSRVGVGTTFSLRLPLTLTIAKLLVCLIRQDNQRTTTAIAIPSDSVAELLVPRPEQIKVAVAQRFLIWQGQTVPIYPLNVLLSYNCSLTEQQASKALMTVPHPEDWQLPLILLKRGNHYYALEVNRLVTEQELVIKPFASVVEAPAYLYGCTILGDGTLIPVVNGNQLLERFWDQGTEITTLETAGAEADLDRITTSQPPLILVADDSAALRRTLALTLEKAGYRVVQAKDGQEALDLLSRTPGIQLVICDVEMPNLNGFEFLGQRRRNPDMMKVPVAMLTSRGSDKHRQLATHLGASAYFTKPYIEQQFLNAIKEMLDRQLVTV